MMSIYVIKAMASEYEILYHGGNYPAFHIFVHGNILYKQIHCFNTFSNNCANKQIQQIQQKYSRISHIHML